MRVSHSARTFISIAACCGGPAAALAQSCAWSGGITPGGPNPRIRYALAYDPVRTRTLLFGGERFPVTSVILNDTWEWDGSTWSPSTPGPAVASGLMCYDAARSRMVLNSGSHTWERTADAWGQASVQAVGNADHVAVFFDTHFQTLTMLRASTTGSELWNWTGAAWVQRATGAGLPASFATASVFDSVRGRIVSYISPDAANTKTWEFDDVAGTWALVSSVGPSPRYQAAMVFDPDTGRSILFGGLRLPSFPTDSHYHDTWEWNGAAWTLKANAEPGAFKDIRACVDSARSRMVLVGSVYPNVGQNQTWEYNSGAANPAIIIAQQPANQVLSPGETAAFHVVATGAGTLGYQWRRNGTPLTDGGNVSGSQTPNLTVGPLAVNDTGFIDVLISDLCGPVASDTCALTVNTVCYANCDISTFPPVLTANDFQCFLGTYAAGSSYANCDGSTASPVLTANDFQCYLNKFAAGCS